ncbi:aldehyde dehydrogenase family protein [Undibacterium arcticum]|uniref:Aldehyde dehydrogenase family protein n=1 Tax=Undibacterium arcticum TaxID=1762892 RepID=A0ABV7F3I1_9BURK
MLSAIPTQLYIDGNWCDATSHQTLPVINPSNEEKLADVAAAGAADVDAAVQAAARAFKTWRHSKGSERARYLRAIASGVDENKYFLARLQSENSGKPLTESAIDVADVIATFAYYADLAEQLDSQQNAAVAIPSEDFQASLRREPCGVVGLIVPWNFPMVTTAWKLAPALAAGCTVVLKPSEVTPLPELALAAIIDATGLPAGVLNVVTGTGQSVGAPLVAHPLLAKISFTGSNAVGSMVMKTAAESIKGVSLELGGKSPILVFADADLDLAVSLVTGGIFFNAGQMCSATSRLLVGESIADEFLARLKQATEEIVIGNPLAENTQMGPLVNRAQYERVLRYIERGIADGAKLVTGGGRAADCQHGFFVAPTIFNEVPLDSVIWREEIFGPVLCVRSFINEQEAVALANDSEYGLVATVVTGSAARATRVSAALEAGMVWVNAPQVIFPQTSWGGMKKSSLGRELGPWGLAAFQEIKHVVTARA